MLKALLKIIFRRRAIWLANIMQPYIHEGMIVLVFGCGTLTIAEEVAKTKTVQTEGVDVMGYNLTDLPLSIYDGRRTHF